MNVNTVGIDRVRNVLSVDGGGRDGKVLRRRGAGENWEQTTSFCGLNDS
ncbi:Uncharacterized protein ToN1_26030 [Aromatoleum petrolei]|nr:Uncharacterized protein ToN1_26030 [Aromatoleum petrolei]